MIGALVRVILGFALAALTAGAVFVLFALPPGELLSDRSPGFGALVDWSLKAATQTAIFAAPFALIAAAIGEWQSLRGPIFYCIAGLLIAVAGFMAQQSSETAGQLTVVNSYAMGAFFASGLLGGLVYWLLAGRLAGEDETEPVIVRPTASGPGAGAKPARVAEPKSAEAGKPTASPKPSVIDAPKVADPKAADVAKPAKPAATVEPAVKPAAETKPAAAPASSPIADETRPAVSDPEAKN